VPSTSSYSFRDISASISGPGGTLQLASGIGTADEGISFEKAEDRNTMTPCADGYVMHSLHAARAGLVRVRLLKTSVTNGLMMDLFKATGTTARTWGAHVISLEDRVRGEKVVASRVAFSGEPALMYGKQGNVHEWTFHAGHIESSLGKGQRTSSQ